MGKLTNPSTQNLGGKVGWIVGYTRLGQYCQRAMPQHVYNPRTLAQESHRALFSLLSNFFSVQRDACIYGTHSNKAEAVQKVMSINYKNGTITGTYPAYSIDYDKVKLTDQNKILGYKNGTATQGTGQTCHIQWTDNTGEDVQSLASDVACVSLYNQNKNMSVPSMNSAVRDDEQLSVSYPSNWTGDTIIVFGFFRSTGDEMRSETIKLGTFVAN